ncbi:MAG: transcription-repair coupling factor [Flavobacteriales bacterium]|jgi:transcription-repair coupling factor (superfamily II helicase)|nr:transcription-repair coupling factor [Flavobacteriales bacterium]
MTSQKFIENLLNQENSVLFQDFLEQNKEQLKTSKGLAHSWLSVQVYGQLLKTNAHQLVIVEDKDEAVYLLNDFQQFVGDENCFFFPSSYRNYYEIEEVENANILFRAEAIQGLQKSDQPKIVVTYPDALFEKVVDKKSFQSVKQAVNCGDKIDLEFLTEYLNTYHFERVDYVFEPGQFSVRGEIVDVFSFSDDFPFRIQLFDDEIESIRTFDPSSQVSVEKHTSIEIIPNIEVKENESRVSFLEYFSNESQRWIKNIQNIKEQLDKRFVQASEKYQTKNLESTIALAEPQKLYLTGKDFVNEVLKKNSIEFGSQIFDKKAPFFDFSIKPQRGFNRDFEWMSKQLTDWSTEGKMVYLCCANQKQIQRFEEIFEKIGETEVKYIPLLLSLYQGFELENTIVLTDHQIFERYHKYKLKNQDFKKNQFNIEELTKLEIGDYVSHIDHGIGKYGGLQKMDVNGKKQEVIKIIYKNNDLLYVSIHSLHKISKFNGKEGTVPSINQLGSPKWSKLKSKTKSKIKKIAYDLIQVYAKRKTAKGFSYAPDNYLMHELEASFIFEETEDQGKAIEDVKRDMENPMPMDRLVCGDVGFGKTEVAIRAAFKAVCDSKQVVVLVPTTILALQHYKSFKKRLKNLPCNIDYINRFRTAKQQKETIQRLKDGKVDIIIGTHRIVGKDIKFKDLGLLIIDEEQKFGVAIKDKLKSLKANIDTLTLTATPIPRTLQFSLMAARDLSVINTPPANRYPVDTRLIGFNEETIRDAIRYELDRGGQVYLINNRVENIKEVAGMVQRLAPDARVSIGHGQMEGNKLEQIMMSFIEGESDVLVATSIIENGLDVPNANTILVLNAQNFGLSDLHQMRGRVGRSNKKAYAYLISPPLSNLSTEAKKRLQALQQFSDLGSGFHIAMKDLEIRGAGDLLGGEQSGFINDIGFETYNKILAEAVKELKENEFKELYEDEGEIEYLSDCQIDTDFELLIPTDYVSVISERLNLYHKLNKATNEDDLNEFETILEDRFGTVPVKTQNLIASIPLKWMGKDLGIEKVVLKSNKMILYFVSDTESPYYQSEIFQNILMKVQGMGKKCRLKQKNNRLSVVFDEVKTINSAKNLLSSLKEDNLVKS